MAHHSPVAGECERSDAFQGAVAQLGERRLCKAEVGGSSPPGSTTTRPAASHRGPRVHPTQRAFSPERQSMDRVAPASSTVVQPRVGTQSTALERKQMGAVSRSSYLDNGISRE